VSSIAAQDAEAAAEAVCRSGVVTTVGKNSASAADEDIGTGIDMRTDAADTDVAMKERDSAADFSPLSSITTGDTFRDI